MRVKLEYDKTGCIWHGIGQCGEWRKADGSKIKLPYYNCGFFAIDWYTNQKKLTIYFWQFDLSFTWETQ